MRAGLELVKADRVILDDGRPCIRLQLLFCNTGAEQACFLRTWDVCAYRQGRPLERCYEPDRRGRRDVGILTAIEPGESIGATLTFFLGGDGAVQVEARDGGETLRWGPLAV